MFPSSFVDPPSAARTRPTSGAGDADCELRFGSWTLDSDTVPMYSKFCTVNFESEPCPYWIPKSG